MSGASVLSQGHKQSTTLLLTYKVCEASYEFTINHTPRIQGVPGLYFFVSCSLSCNARRVHLTRRQIGLVLIICKSTCASEGEKEGGWERAGRRREEGRGGFVQGEGKKSKHDMSMT